MAAFDLSGALRRIRRLADVSQRELAEACGLTQSAVAQAESGRRGLPVEALSRAAALAGLRVALLDTTGTEVTGMSGDAVRDGAGRRFPAHLDTRYGEQRWWHGTERYSRRQPWYTFDRDRETRDAYRRRDGTPEDHQLPQPGDSPQDRAFARRRAAALARQERFEQLRAAGRPTPVVDPWTCTCPPACAELDDYEAKPVHTENCPCRCDVG